MSRIIVSLVILALTACFPLPEEDGVQSGASPQASYPSAARPLTTENGGSLNGGSLNGGSLNGNDLSGFLVSVDYAQAVVGGKSNLDWLWLGATWFLAKRNGEIYAGYDFKRAEFIGNLGDGRKARLRIADMRQAAPPNGDLAEYWLEYQDDAGVWYPACRNPAGTAVWAYPVRGTYDYRSGVPTGGAHLDDPAHFTFACDGGAIAKCINLGYRPWASKDGEPLARYHQACTRLLRGDYCGDGSSYTKEGNRVNLYDILGIQQDTEDWVFEANWDENGARCFYPLNRSRAGIPCYDSRVEMLCGQNGQPEQISGLLRNETPTAGLTP